MLTFQTPSGHTILVGQNARENDQLTFVTAKPMDLWFHVRDHPGAHVILRMDGPATDGDVYAAAFEAAQHSKAVKAVDVTVARAIDVVRPRKARPGQVHVMTVLKTIRIRQ